MQLGRDTPEEPSSIMTFFANLGVTRIFCSFKLFRERKAYKEILESSKWEFLENISGNISALPPAENKTQTVEKKI